ncbi:hypothetical protein Naga_100603g2 [Nannochloropsis gaditana]|uniref:Uncharacterized protein n=1 Tax=Nannochloropsis gaditana TaxID=72520 RepID=W7TU03_9STRA|nr:hypothetical protein Naga_100603g2 [Nannochloropsis gaditana]
MSATIIVTYLLVVCPGANALASNRSFTTKQIIQLLHFALFLIIESMTGNVVVIRKQMAFRRQFLFILGLGLLLFLHVVSITHAFFVKPRPFSTKSTYLNSASTSCYTWPQAQVSPSPLVSAARRGTLHWTKQSYPSALRAMGSSEILLAADLKKVLSDDIYGPMFLQALFLSVSGFLAAAALAGLSFSLLSPPFFFFLPPCPPTRPSGHLPFLLIYHIRPCLMRATLPACPFPPSLPPSLPPSFGPFPPFPGRRFSRHGQRSSYTAGMS